MSNPPNHFCSKCLSNLSETVTHKKLKRARNILAREFLDQVEIKCEKLHEKYEFQFKGPKILFDHKVRLLVFSELPEFLLSKPNILKTIQEGKKVYISKKFTKTVGFHQAWASEEIRNISYMLAASQLNKTSFVTSTSLDINILNSLYYDSEILRRNQVAAKYMSCFVPFYEDIPLEQLIKLRNRERESFVEFRKALTEMIDAFRKEKRVLKKSDAQAIYRDIIYPHLNKLEKRSKSAKKDLIVKSTKSTVSIVGAISFGLYSGFLPPDLAVIAKAFGLVKITDQLEKITPPYSNVKEVESDPLFFLWKAKQLKKKK